MVNTRVDGIEGGYYQGGCNGGWLLPGWMALRVVTTRVDGTEGGYYQGGCH